MDKIVGTLSSPQSITGTLQGGNSIVGRVAIGGSYRKYDGSYEITPTEYEQVLETSHRSMSEDIKVNPIPKNYGLITWDGSTLHVS